MSSHSRDPKNLTKGQIQNAIRNTPSLKKASAYLNVCYDTFRKYAVRHGISISEHSNQQGRGIMKPKVRSNRTQNISLQLCSNTFISVIFMIGANG